MLPLYKTRFEVVPADVGLSHGSIAEQMIAFVELWVADSFVRSGLEPRAVELVSDFSRDAASPPQRRSLTLDCGAFIHSVLFPRQDEKEPSRAWISLVDLVSDCKKFDFQFQLGIESGTLDLEGERPRTGRPRIISTILTAPRWSCHSGGQRLSVTPIRLVASEMEEFCENVLFSSVREWPVVVLTPLRDRRWYPIEPRMLAERLGGTAKTYVLRDDLAVEVLDQCLQRSMAIGPDAIRVFPPGAAVGGGVEGHWHFLGETLRAKHLPHKEFADLLFRRLADRALLRFRESDVLNSVRRLANEEREQRLSHLRREGEEHRALAEDYATHLDAENRRILQENAELLEQNRRKDAQIADLEVRLADELRNIATLSRQLGRPEVEHAEITNEEGEVLHVEDIVARAQTANLVILESALESAKKVPKNYEFPARVASALEALRRAADHRNACRGRVEGGWKKFFESQGFEYKGKLSEVARNNWSREYSFMYEGKRELFEEHFTIGAKSANTCLSIHFSTSLRDDSIVVAYVGRHLRNTMT